MVDRVPHLIVKRVDSRRILLMTFPCWAASGKTDRFEQIGVDLAFSIHDREPDARLSFRPFGISAGIGQCGP